MLLQSIDLIAQALLILFQFGVVDLEFVKFKVVVFSKDIFVLISPEKLLLCVLMLLILTFKVSELSIHLVQVVLQILDVWVSITNLSHGLGNHLLFVTDQRWDAFNSLVVVVLLGMQDLEALGLAIEFFV